jgi:hypothetical protein
MIPQSRFLVVDNWFIAWFELNLQIISDTGE